MISLTHKMKESIPGLNINKQSMLKLNNKCKDDVMNGKCSIPVRICLILMVIMMSGSTLLGVTPTNEWVNFYSTNTTFDGSPVPVGAVIEAYDPDNVLCGSFTVTTQGQYGFLLVYKDDFTTPDIDEGAQPGDTITFYIDGHLALPKGPSAPVWTSNGAILQLNLEGHSNYDPVITSSPITTAIEKQEYTYAVIATDLDNDPLTYTITVSPDWMTIDTLTGVISGIPQNDDTGDTTVTVQVADGKGGVATQTYTLTVKNVNDPPVLLASFPDSLLFRSDTTHVIHLDNYVEDIDNPVSSLTWSVSGNDSITVTLDGATREAVFSASHTFSGIEKILFQVMDDSLASDTATVTVTVIPYIYNASIALNENWNLVSWNVNPSNDSVTVVFDDILDNLTILLGFDSFGLVYNPLLPDFSNLFNTNHLSGYWVKTNSVSTLNIPGTEVPADTPIILDAGWNLVSYLPNQIDSVMHAFQSIHENITAVLGFNGGGLSCYPPYPDFNTLHIVSPNYGYWIKLSEKDTLIYPEIQVAAGGFELQKKSMLTSNRKLLNPTNEWINVYGENITINGEPLKAGTLVEARDPDNVVCGEFIVQKEGQFGMMAVYRDDPATDIDEGAEAGDIISVYIDGKKVETNIIWDHFGSMHKISTPFVDNLIPETFQLFANYPNPFNPFTNIQFQIPDTSLVSLEIFNLQGRKVQTLTHENMKPGVYTINWNGQNNSGKLMPSGIYFYTLKTEKYMNTKKMILLR